MAKKIRLNIGCGVIGHLRRKGYIGIDKTDYGQKYVCDALDIKDHIKDGTVDEIAMDMFLEHLTVPESVQMLQICWDLLKYNSLLKIEVPSIERGKAFQFTHRSYYTLDTFRELENEEMCVEVGIKPFKIKEILINGKKNIYCDLVKVRDYPVKLRKTI